MQECGIALPWKRSGELLPGGEVVPLERVHLRREERDEDEDGEQRLHQDRKRQRPSEWWTAGMVVASSEEGECELAWSWEGPRVVLRREGAAAKVAVPLFACVALVRPAVLRERGHVVLVVRAAQQVHTIGSSDSVGICGAKNKQGRRCERLAHASRKCAAHEEERYHKQQSSRMELNSAAAHVPKKHKNEARPSKQAKQRSGEKLMAPEEVVQKMAGEHAGAGLGLRSLAALAGKDAPRVGPPLVTAATLREARSSVLVEGSFLHPNSWQLYQKAAPGTDEIVFSESE
jgi:hypothetical protein